MTRTDLALLGDRIMARLHVLGEWHGPGEEKSAKQLAADLPATWDVIAGRQIPDPRGPVDLDLVLVGPHGVYVCEEKSWGPHVVAGEVAWFSNGDRRHNPADQVAHAVRVLAGRFRTKVAGWGQLPRGLRPVSGHVVMSHANLMIEGEKELGEDVVLRLSDAASVLTARDAAAAPGSAQLRDRVMAYLLGLGQRSAAQYPPQIMQYQVLGKPTVEGNARVFPARTPAGENVGLYCVPVATASDPQQAELLATREHDALAVLAAKERTWRVQSWFDWDGYRVTPIVVAMDGTSLGKLAATGRPEHDRAGRVPEGIGATVVHDAFVALATVHAQGITHRALQMRSVEVTPANRVRFRDFSRAHLPATTTIAPLLDDAHRSAAFQPPGLAVEFFQPRDDVYGLALCLVQWLHGDAADQPDHDLARQRAAAYPVVGPVLARCLDLRYNTRPDAVEAADATAPARSERAPARPVATEPEMVADSLIDGRYRLLRQLGAGSWAVTWLAYDENVSQNRTLKHMRPGRVGIEQVRAEYAHADLLRSRHCARVYDVLTRPEPGVLVQEYIDGQTLQDLAAGRDLDGEQYRRIAVDVLTGLADAHEQLLYHRDVSPSNIIVRDDGSAVLIDFGLASKADAARSAVGSPPFTAPEVWSRREWSTSADIYSVAASVLFALLGRFPYAGPGVEERRTLVLPSEQDEARYGRAMLAALYEGVAHDPGDRPSDAAAFAERVARARDTEPAPGSREVNPTVDALRGLYRHSGVGNAGNRGMDDDFARDTYVPSRLDTVLLPSILRGELDVVVLSGNPGDGKTSFLVRVGDALDKEGAQTLHRDAAGWRKQLSGRTFAAVYDASESHESQSSDDLLRSALAADPGEASRTVLLAANDGRIAQFFTDHEDRYPAIAEEMRRQWVADAPAGSRIVLVDLKRRALALPASDNPSLGAEILGKLTALHRWEACSGCVARNACPIRLNAVQLRRGGARKAVAELLLTSHLRRRRRATVRDVRSAFGWLITGDLSCADVHAEHSRGQDPRTGPNRRAFDLAFASGSGDYLVQEWSELDPAGLPAPGAARAARGRREIVPDLAAVEHEDMARLKRALFFGEWSAPAADHEVRSYRYLAEYVDALHEPEPALPRVLLGLSRVLAFVGYDAPHLALRDRAFDDPAARAIVVVKELRAAEFTLAPATSGSVYVESFPDQLVLRHRSGGRLTITLDTAELLLRAADGEILVDTASAALRHEIEGFGNRLRLQPARSVWIVDGAGRSVTAAVGPGGRIVREAR